MARSPASRPDVLLFDEIAAIDQLALNRMERLLPSGLTRAQFGVLGRLVDGGERSPAHLAEVLRVTKGAMTSVLQKLEARGLIAVEADAADGRRKRVSITSAGLAEHAAALIALRSMTEGLRQRFAATDFEQALPFLAALRAWLEPRR